jgi:hypothetical protein
MNRHPVDMLHFSSSTKVVQKLTTRCMGSSKLGNLKLPLASLLLVSLEIWTLKLQL